jgi:hypothetical protein
VEDEKVEDDKNTLALVGWAAIVANGVKEVRLPETVVTKKATVSHGLTPAKRVLRWCDVESSSDEED